MSHSRSEEDQILRFDVDESEAGKRLDAVIAAKDDRFSRSRFKSLIKDGQVSLATSDQPDRTIDEPNHRVNAGDRITVTLPPAEDPTPLGEDIPLDVVFEDDDLIVINKPAGLVVHPAAGNWTGTLVNALIHHCGESLSGIGGVRRPGIVHRLDKETSGLLVVAKTDAAHKGLSEQFADHGRNGPLTRAYQALVWGELRNKKGTIDTQIGRAPHNRLRQKVLKAGGRQAITHYQVLEEFGVGDVIASRVECRLETGRTHQIRVHMAHIGHPLIGDLEYGQGFKSKLNKLPEDLACSIENRGRQSLHAGELGFAHPISGEEMSFQSEMPSDLNTITEALQKI
ncbi:23S rRNA pseudouridine1911/1915/1917 synthase [Cohaesibacter sp. ES.047]|uniref:RluA family pseudouridine synthase n=1 Tax=Cohaesibacter sp. ES.047 TaxID=1798205 RepID=UPI000BB77570|nr:RluA family pseudouridine synthase [Cohaesibacter sp. ES.047]SNY90996.1 23S rRNA pseudouridine1911/1915/1917 synthase [Cohaesibacter sp. ES.047]